ncbi:hypothetical protein ACNOYE_00245 [Nannocystaceae bacterium ST9]
MDERDGDHWLWRLEASGWLDAAAQELERGEAALAQRRTAITHARRAAGMALNAVLVDRVARGDSPGRSEAIWGRSYIDHLRTLADPQLDPDRRAPFDEGFARACAELLAIPVMAPTNLVRIARSRDEAASSALALARELVRACEAQVARPAAS